MPSCAFGPLCAFGPRRQEASVGRRRRSLKLAPLGRPKTTASAAQAPPAPPSGGSKRPPSPGGPGFCRAPRQQSKTAARRLALLSGATSARAKQHGGVYFHRARASAARGHNSTAARASTSCHVNSQSPAARRRALVQSGHGATSTAMALQHGGVRFCRSGRGSQGTAARRRALLSGATLASQSNTARRRLLPQSACLVSPRAQQHGGVRFYVAPRQQPERSSAGALASAERHDNQSAAALRRALLQSEGHGETKRGR